MKSVLAVRLGAIMALVFNACGQAEPEVRYHRDGGNCFATVEASSNWYKYPRFGVVLIPCEKIPINASR